MKILVCDDQRDRCEANVAAISDLGLKGTDVVPLHEEGKPNLQEQLEILFRNVRIALREESGGTARPTAFDDADLVVLDNNLAHLVTKGARLTAEAIAGYVRAFTTAPYVVSLNKNPDVDFDLRFLVGDYTTRADLALNDRHLVNRALWTGDVADAPSGFRPWYWPTLGEVASRRRRQIEFVSRFIDDAILPKLGFSDDTVRHLSRHALGTLSPTDRGASKHHTEVTFRDLFLRSNRSIPDQQDRLTLSDVGGTGDAVIARVVAAEIDLWFRRDLLAPQDVLVDLPHLFERLPFLLGERAVAVEGWNNGIADAAGMVERWSKEFDPLMLAARYDGDIWTSKPCFWWPTIKADPTLNNAMANSEIEWADVAFCEDCSAFAERKLGTAEPKEFLAEFEGSWARRQVVGLQGIKYAPRSRFAL